MKFPIVDLTDDNPPVGLKPQDVEQYGTWESDSYGFCAINESDRLALAQTLEALRRQVCAYGGGGRCDCKYGLTVDPEIGPRDAVREEDNGIREWSYDYKLGKHVMGKNRPGSENTGCPELREMIHRLLHRDLPLF